MPKDTAHPSAADLDAMFPEDSGQPVKTKPGVSAAELDGMFPEDGGPPEPAPPPAPTLGVDGLPVTEGPPILEGTGLSLAKGITSDIGSSVAGMHEAVRRFGAGLLGKAVGPRAEQIVYTAVGYTPQHLLWKTLDNEVFDPLGAYWREGKLEELDRAVQGRGVLDMWRTGDLFGFALRGFAANAPQLAVSMGSGGLLAKAGTGLAAKALGLALPVAMETGETVAGLEAHEAATGERLDNLRFGGVALAKGLAAGLLESLGAGALLGKASAAFPLLAKAKGGLQFLGEVGTEGLTEGAQTFVGNVAEDLALRPPASMEEYGARWLDPSFRKQMMEDVGPSAFLGSFSGMAVAPFTTDWGRPPDDGPVLPTDAEVARSVADRERRRLVPGRIDESLPMSDAATVRSYLESQFTNLDTEQKGAVFEVLERQVDAIANTTKLDRSHVWGRFLTEAQAGGVPLRRLYQGAERGEFVVTHNLSAGDPLALFLQLRGQVPGLSLAVTRADEVLTEALGPITLVFDPKTINLAHGAAVAYDRDAGTPTFPREKVARNEAGLFVDVDTGSPLTPDALARLYTAPEPGLGLDVQAAIRVRSLGEARDAVRRARVSEGAIATSEARLAEVLSGVALEVEDAPAELVGAILEEAHQQRVSLATAERGWRRFAAANNVSVPPAQEQALLSAALDCAQDLQDAPARLAEVKLVTPPAADAVVGAVVDEDLVTPEELAELRRVGEELGWRIVTGKVAVTPDSRVTDFRQVGIRQFADRFLQRSGSVVKGQTSVLPDGRFLIEAFKAHDVSTAVHELAHGWRQTLYWAESMAPPHERKRLQADLKTLESWAGVENGRWTKAAEEKWARGCERYLMSGKAPVAALDGLFARFKEWLGSVYAAAREVFLPSFTPEVATFFDTYVLDVRAPEATPGFPAPIDKKAWRKEHRQAVALARNLRNLEPQRALFVAELQELEKLKGMALANVPLKGALDFAEREVAEGNVDLEGTVAEGRERVARRKRLFELVVQTVREIKGNTILGDVVAEGEAVRTITERLWAEPNLIRRYIADATAAIERKAAEINEATLLYKTVTRKIAARGLSPETWAADAEDWSIFEKAELEEIQKEVRAEVAAARLEIEATDPTVLATEGVVLDISGTMNLLADVLHRGTELGHAATPSTFSPDVPAAVGIDLITETAKLFDGGQDQVIDRMEEALRTPIRVVRDGWRPLAEAVRDHGDAQFRTGQTLSPFGKPVRHFNPKRYDNASMVAKLSRKFGLRWRESVYGAEQMPEVEQAFASAAGKVEYYDNVASPRTREAFYRLLPDLPARQLVTLTREFKGVELQKIREHFQRRVLEAEAAYADFLEKLKTVAPADEAALRREAEAAEKEWKVWKWRAARVDGHRTLQRMEMSPRVAYALRAIGATYDAFFMTAAANELIGSTALVEDFLNWIYRRKDLDAARPFFKERLPLDKKNPHAFHRVFETLIEAHAFGLTPATLDIAELVDSYGRSLVQSVAKRQLVMELMAVAPQAFRWEKPRTAGTSARDSRVALRDAAGPKGPTFLPLDRYISHATQETIRPGKEEVLYAEEHLWNLFHNLYEDSAFDRNPVLYAMKKVNAWLKRIQLAIDLYHFFQITRMAMSLGHVGAANARIGKVRTPFVPYQLAIDALGMTDPAHPKHVLVRRLMEEGLQMSSGDWARRKLHEYLEVTVGKKVMPGLYHKLGHKLEAFSQILWEEYVPGLKVMVAVQQLDRLQRNPRTRDLPEAQLFKAAATFTNDVFGGMAWRTHGRSKTQQDLLKILFLAPDWLETRFRTVTGLVKSGPERELWMEYWFGGGAVHLRERAEAALKNDPSLVTGGPVRWATGYLLQGMAFTAFANAVIWGAFAAGAGEDDDDYPQGMEWFTSILMPTKDRRGAPLRISLFSTVDYVTAFLNDIPSISVLVSYWTGRQSPILRAAREIVLGRDFAGRALRPELLSAETVMIIAENAMPWLNNILYGSATEPFFQDRWEFYAIRNISRTMGGHTTSSYPRQLQEEYDFLVAQARSWNGFGKKTIERFLTLPEPLRYGILGYARAKAAIHNRRVRGLIRKVQNDPYIRGQMGRRLVADKRHLFMWSP